MSYDFLFFNFHVNRLVIKLTTYYIISYKTILRFHRDRIRKFEMQKKIVRVTGTSPFVLLIVR